MKPVDVQERVEAKPAACETILLGMRTMKGIDLARFKQEYGLTLFRQLESNAMPLKEAGLLRATGGRLKLTESGILLSNEVCARLSP
jgi:oxygen-independent coproporphyrinogen-3 oxidase